MTATATRPRTGTGPSRPSGPAAGGPDASAHDTRRTLLAGLACALGALPLCGLFVDRGWLIDVWLTMAVVVGPAALMRRTRPATAGQVWVGVLLLIPWLTVNFVREHAVLGIVPLGGAWHDVGQLMHDLHETTTNEVAPVHTTVAVRLAVCVLLGLTTALVDLLAVVGRRGALAGVPLLIIFTVSGAVPRRPVSWTWFALAAVGFLILLALDSSDDLQRWGHFVPRSRTAGRRAAGVFSGQRIAGAAILLAVVLPLAIPGNSRNVLADLFHSNDSGLDQGFGHNDSGGSGSNGIDPFVALKGDLNRRDNISLLDVTVTPGPGQSLSSLRPFYLRTNVLSVFEGDGWRPGPDGASTSLSDSQFDSRPGTPFAPRTVDFSAELKITGLRSNPPVFGSPTSLSGVDGSTQWSPENMLLVGSHVSEGQDIQETVAQPDPTVADLRAATGTDPSLAGWLRLPTIAPSVRALTRRIVAGATTPYDKARAIADFFADPKNGFTYSLTTTQGDTGNDLADFLERRVGFCQQYAAAMGVMLRLSGVPARVVLGYAHAEPDANGTFTVKTYDAHAWDEAYFSGVGWVPFDPTPLAGISGGKAGDLAWAPHTVAKSHVKIKPGRGPVVLPTRRVAPPRDQPAASSHHSAAPRSGATSFTVPLVVLGVLVLGGLVLLTPAAVRRSRRRRRLHLARHGDTDALWAELSDTATDLGYVWSDARTPRQVALWLGGSSDAAIGSLRTITSAVEQARYAPPTNAPRGAELVRELDTVRQGLLARRSPRDRWRAVLWPASLDWSAVPVVGRWLPGGTPGQRH